MVFTESHQAFLVRVTGFEPAAPCSQSRPRAFVWRCPALFSAVSCAPASSPALSCGAVSTPKFRILGCILGLESAYLKNTSKQLGRLNGELVVSTPKTPNSIRTVVIPQQAVDLLVAEHEKHPDSPYLFPSPRTGGMFSPDSAGRIHKTLLKKAGIDEGVRFHDLRHTFATLALQNGVDVKTVSSMLGHYSAGFTLDTYTHITTKMQQEAADKMGGFMDAAMPEESECKIIPFEQVE